MIAPSKENVAAACPVVRRRCIFIRHAQSEENVKISHIRAGWNRIVHDHKLPTGRQVRSGLELLRYELDAPVSEHGIISAYIPCNLQGIWTAIINIF
jgi:hypothetical protein